MATSRLETLFDAVVAELEDRLGSGNYATHVYDPTGKQEIHKVEHVPPVIIWGRDEGTFGPSRATSWTADASERRELATRQAGVLLHVWGTDEDDADTILENEYAALHSVCNTSFRIVSEVPGAANEAWLGFGFAIVAKLQLDLPMRDIAELTGQATSFAVGDATSTPGDGYLESGEA